ncbi:UNVERIFIED_CONTAM: hypothetical protein NCL1_45554 [Trichonephila clavipes]
MKFCGRINVSSRGKGTINTQNTHYWSFERPTSNTIESPRSALVGTCVVRNMEKHRKWKMEYGKASNCHNVFLWTFNIRIIHEILSGPLADLLEDKVSFRDLSRMWYQHDGATTNKSAQPCTFLPQTFDTRIIGYGGDQQEWPPRSRDLSPLDFFLYSFLTSKVYERESTSKYDLLNRISMECKSVTPTMLQKLQAEFLTRVRYCISADGSHFEYYLS